MTLVIPTVLISIFGTLFLVGLIVLFIIVGLYGRDSPAKILPYAYNTTTTSFEYIKDYWINHQSTFFVK